VKRLAVVPGAIAGRYNPEVPFGIEHDPLLTAFFPTWSPSTCFLSVSIFRSSGASWSTIASLKTPSNAARSRRRAVSPAAVAVLPFLLGG
jgi:hypothetical protein